MPNFHLINICVFYRYYNFFLICHDISFPFRTILGGRKIAITIVRNNNTGFFFFWAYIRYFTPIWKEITESLPHYKSCFVAILPERAVNSFVYIIRTLSNMLNQFILNL
uniref:Putative uncharacterized protein YLR202C n=1 Tax=Saccharomyces cerevisiae (strain ATCC 204508 / S288c) TaxID=559292 RepID=YL202_YEAST|nr:RecName: Full=Putative uncharacterized protein YLR202C [Saccharomyces cerevisiae S288C]AAB67450.1 Ylr202cp [Saccharomyces cerevisiae]